MCLAQGPQRSDAGEAQTRCLESSTLPLSHLTPYTSSESVPPCQTKQVFFGHAVFFKLPRYSILLFFSQIINIFIESLAGRQNS